MLKPKAWFGGQLLYEKKTDVLKLVLGQTSHLVMVTVKDDAWLVKF